MNLKTSFKMHDTFDENNQQSYEFLLLRKLTYSIWDTFIEMFRYWNLILHHSNSHCKNESYNIIVIVFS